MSLTCLQGQAHDQDESYRNPLLQRAIRALQFDASSVFIKSSERPLRVRTHDPLTDQNKKTLTTTALVGGLYKFDDIEVWLNLKATIDKGVVSFKTSKDTMDQLIQQWVDRYADLQDFKKWDPTLEKVTFFDEEAIGYELDINGRYTYRLVLKANFGEDMTPKIKQVKKFIKFIDRDKRSQAILSNNRSNRPAKITFQQIGPQTQQLVAFHPMHRIIWNPEEDTTSYSYLGDYDHVRKLPEIKKIRKNQRIRELFDEEKEQVRIRASGDPKNGFRFTLNGRNSNTLLKASLKEGKVQIQ